MATGTLQASLIFAVFLCLTFGKGLLTRELPQNDMQKQFHIWQLR